MSTANYEKIIRDFSKYFNLGVKDIKLEDNGKLPIIKTNKNDKILVGLRNLNAQVQSTENAELKALEEQWIEYGLTHALTLESSATGLQVLKELNDYMADRVYFVGNKKGPTDILMYYFLYNTVSGLSFQEKEKYLHACRWFNNIQQDERARQWRSQVYFSRTRLYI